MKLTTMATVASSTEPLANTTKNADAQRNYEGNQH
jgi:hypothetical protein